MTKKSRTPQIPTARKALTCELHDNPDVTRRRYAEGITGPEVALYRVIEAVEPKNLTERLDGPSLMQLVRDQVAAVQAGDLGSAEAALVVQSSALQTIFVRLTERAMAQDHLPNLEVMLKLALRAQSQSRATLETLAAIKNPPVVIARQANVTTGPQQVNNGVTAPARARKKRRPPNELLEDKDGKRLDTRATSATGRADQAMAPLGGIDRPED
jgi:hypothetical protein